MESQTKICQNCKQDFIIEPDDFAFYEKIKVPAPTFCPDCRMMRRMLWRNERGLYKTVCGLCNQNIISMYDPNNELKVYCDKCWWSDKWDSMGSGVDIDWSQDFFSQWKRLLKQTPLIQAWRFKITGSDYMNYGTECKNCYLSSSITFCENIFYSYAIDKSQDIIDSSFVSKSNWCYENIDSYNNYNSIFLDSCNDCMNSSFLFDCINCQNCFMSSNLRNKNYFFKNKQITKLEYETKISEIRTNDFSILQNLFLEFLELKKKSIHKYIRITNGVKCSGNNIQNCRNSLDSFNAINSENTKYVFRTVDCKDSMDVLGAVKTELAYESVAPSFEGSDTQFSITNQSTQNIRYSFICASSHNLFGCVGLKHKEYCILNKQYTKEEYETLVPKIIQLMNDLPYIDKKGRIYKYGEFFPSEISPFCYNEAVTQEYFSLTRENVLGGGYKWKDSEKKDYVIDIKNEDISEIINRETIGKVVGCKHNGECNDQCTTAFKITPYELQFYIKMNLPLPRLCPNCRHYKRMVQRNALKLWHRKCMHEGCSNEFETSYAPDRPEIIYCEQCYNAEVA